MNILYLIEKYPPALGGDGVHVKNLRECIGYPSSILTKCETGASSEKDILRVGINSNALHGRLIFLFKAYQIAKAAEYDILHAHGQLCALAGSRIKKVRKKPVVYTIHGIWDKILDATHGRLAPVFRELEKKALSSKYDAIISVDSWAEKKVRELNDSPVYRIPNGVDIEKFRPNGKREDLVFSAGRLVVHKGYDYLIDTIPEGTTLEIAGSGPEKERLEKMGKAKLLGTLHQEDLIKKYQKCSIFVLPSLWEGFPFSLLEAMGCGCACIASNVGGVPDLIDNGKNGLLVEPGNTKELREKISYLHENEAVCKKLGKKARKKVVKNFTWKIVAKKTRKVYQSVL